MKRLGSVLKAAVVAGLIAGAAAAGFHWLLIEPVIDRAIDLEELHSQARGVPEKEPVIDRPTQRWGLLLGLLLYGAVWGVLFGQLYYLTQAWLGTSWSIRQRALLLVLVMAWSVSLFPFVKYPANPPGVGEPETISYRQALYFGFIGLSIVGSVLAVGLYRFLNRLGRLSARGRWGCALCLYVLYATVVYVAMPPNPDPIGMPGELVWTFRAISLGGLLLFWGALGGLFGWLSSENPRRALAAR
jgi:hypothetical protein